MCLSWVTSRKRKKGAKGRGYVVYKWIWDDYYDDLPLSGVFHGCRKDFGKTYSEKHPSQIKEYEDYELIVYPGGYHVWTSLKAAKKWLDEWREIV